MIFPPFFSDASSDVSFVGVESASDDSTLEISRPAGVQENDLLVLFLCRDLNTIPLPAPSGFTSVSSGGTGSARGNLCFKVASASEPSSYVVASSTTRPYGILAAFRGVGGDNSTGAAFSSTTTQEFTIPSFTAGKPGALFVAIVQAGNTNFVSPPPGVLLLDSLVSSRGTARAELYAAAPASGGVKPDINMSFTASSLHSVFAVQSQFEVA